MYIKIGESDIKQFISDIPTMSLVKIDKLLDYLYNETNLDLTTCRYIIEDKVYMGDGLQDMRITKDKNLKYVILDTFQSAYYNVTASYFIMVLKYQLASKKYRLGIMNYTKQKLKRDIDYLKKTRVHVPTLANMIRKWEKTNLKLYKINDWNDIESIINGNEMRLYLEREFINYEPTANIKHMQKLREMQKDYYILDYGFLNAEDISAKRIVEILEYQLKYGKYNDR